MTMPERLKQQLELGHAVVGLAIALIVPCVGFVISYKLMEERLAQALVRVASLERAREAQDARMSAMEKLQIQNHGELKEFFGRIDERLKAIVGQRSR